MKKNVKKQNIVAHFQLNLILHHIFQVEDIKCAVYVRHVILVVQKRNSSLGIIAIVELSTQSSSDSHFLLFSPDRVLYRRNIPWRAQVPDLFLYGSSWKQEKSQK